MIQRLFISCLCCLWGLAAWANQSITIALDWYPSPNHAPILLAEAAGLFKQAGLDVKLISPVESHMPIKYLLAKKADLAISYEPSYHLAKAAKLPLQWVDTLIDHPLGCLMVKRNINNLKDLKGKRIGYSGGASSLARIDTMLQTVGLHMSDVQLMNIKMDLLHSLETGHVDGVMGVHRNVEPLIMADMGIQTTCFLPEKYGVKPYAELIFVAREGEKTPWLPAFQHAIVQARQSLYQHPAQAWEKLSKTFHDALCATQRLCRQQARIFQETVKRKLY